MTRNKELLIHQPRLRPCACFAPTSIATHAKLFSVDLKGFALCLLCGFFFN